MNKPSGEIVTIEIPILVTMSFGEMFLDIYSLHSIVRALKLMSRTLVSSGIC